MFELFKTGNVVFHIPREDLRIWSRYGSDVWNHPDKYGVSVMPKSQYEDLRSKWTIVSGTGLTLNEANLYLMSIILILYARGHKR